MGLVFSNDSQTTNEIHPNKNRVHKSMTPSFPHLVQEVDTFQTTIDADKLVEKDAETAERLRRRLLRRGFAVLSSPSSSSAVTRAVAAVNEAQTAVSSFFALPPSQKEEFRAPQPQISRRQNRWYVPGTKHEYLKMRMDDEDTSYPSQEVREAVKEAQAKMMLLAAASLRAIADGELSSLPPPLPRTSSNDSGDDSDSEEDEENDGKWVEKELAEQVIKRSHDLTSLVMMHYYPTEQISPESIVSVDGEEKKHQPMKEHHDTGLITLIVVGEIEGLEIQDQATGEWFCAEKELKRGDVVLMVGKALPLVLRKEVKVLPTLHRVQMQRNCHRYSQFLYVTCNMCDV